MAFTILVYVGLDLVGDGLMKLPFLRALRHAWPKAHITWLAGKGRTVYAEVLAPLVDGLIDEVIEDAGIGIDWRELLRRPLQDRRFDLVIDTQRRVKTTLILRRIRHGAFVSGAAGYLLSDARPADASKKRRMVDALLDLVAATITVDEGGEWANTAYLNSPIPSGMGPSLPHRGDGKIGFDVKLKLDPVYREAAEEVLPDKRYIGIAPGAGGVHKRWPLEKFIALANELAEGKLTPVFLLGPDEAELWPHLAEAVPKALFPLQENQEFGSSPLFTIAIAERLKVAVANDSGTGHMLAAANTRLVSLFGPTDPAKFAPYVMLAAVIRAQEFGDETMDAIPVQDVVMAVWWLFNPF